MKKITNKESIKLEGLQITVARKVVFGKKVVYIGFHDNAGYLGKIKLKR